MYSRQPGCRRPVAGRQSQDKRIDEEHGEGDEDPGEGEDEEEERLARG